jgi:ABC-type branched-subunit amino acid transport system ATPase component
MVFLGEPTSGMSKEEISDLIELIYHFGSERGVEWTELD